MLKNSILLGLTLVSHDAFSMKSLEDMALEDMAKKSTPLVKSKPLSQFSLVESEYGVMMDEVKSTTETVRSLSLKEQLEYHQSQIASLFDVQSLKIETLEQEVVQLTERVAIQHQDLLEKNREIAIKDRKIFELEGDLTKVTQENENLKEELGRLNISIQKLREENGQLLQRVGTHELSLEEAHLRNQEQQIKIEQYKQRMAVIRGALDDE